jgi:hypothetical protein
MATRDFQSKNIVVGAGQFLVGRSGVVTTTVPSLVNYAKTAQLPENINDTNWFSVGYTTEGTTLSFEPTYGEVMVDQLLDVAKIFKSGMRVTAATSLSEATLENLLIVLGAADGDFAAGPVRSDLATNPTAASSVMTASLNLGADPVVYAANAAAGGLVTSASAFAGMFASSSVGASAQFAVALNINGGALGYQPVERSICVVGAGPTPASATKSADRFYVGYRAVSMETVGISVKRDDATVFPVTFRLLPFDGQGGADGNATYGRIIDRVY